MIVARGRNDQLLEILGSQQRYVCDSDITALSTLLASRSPRESLRRLCLAQADSKEGKNDLQSMLSLLQMRL